MARISFTLTAYRVIHGRCPRPDARVFGGRHCWAFGTTSSPNVDDESECLVAPPHLTLTQSKRWAKAEAVRRFGDDVDIKLWVLAI